MLVTNETELRTASPGASIIKDMSFYSNQSADSDSRWGRLLPDSEPAGVFACTPLRFMRNILLLYQ
jgi:hypothetical protein